MLYNIEFYTHYLLVLSQYVSTIVANVIRSNNYHDVYSNYGVQNPMNLVCEADMLLQGMVGGWAVIEASHTVSSGLNVTCHMLTVN